MLDIGCGDGFYASRFYVARCRHVDAIDVDQAALETARRFSRHPRIAYYLRDAVREAFPRSSYDVIALDGALGHLTRKASDTLLEKIASTLAEDGAFSGSEALGLLPNEDHLQMFESVEALAASLHVHFPVVKVREISYSVGDVVRREAYWRCATGNECPRLQHAEWSALGSSP
jgi:SAM-dependent methyltransferase